MIHLVDADVLVVKLHVPGNRKKLQVYISARDISHEYLGRGLTCGIIHTFYFKPEHTSWMPTSASEAQPAYIDSTTLVLVPTCWYKILSHKL